MKMCLCISGQLRGTEPLKELKKKLANLPKEIELTIIFSVWSISGTKIDGEIDYGKLHRIFTPELAQIIPTSFYGKNFWSNFPLTYEKLVNSSKEIKEDDILYHFPSAVIDIESNIVDLGFDKSYRDKNSKRMLYKIWRCNELKRKIEKDNGLFDCVIRLRPDLIFDISPQIVNGSFSEDEIFIPHEPGLMNFSHDALAYGSSSVLDQYSKLFHRAVIEDNWAGIHTELNKWLISRKIEEKPSLLISIGGFYKNKNLEYKDITGDNRKVDFLWKTLNQTDHDNDTILYIENMVRDEKDKGMIISLYLLLSKIKKIKGDPTSSLLSFLNADLSQREMLYFKHERNNFVLKELILLIKESGIKYPDFIIITKNNPILKQNIENLKLNFHFLAAFLPHDFHRRLNKENVNNLESLVEDFRLSEPFADYFRELAISVEKHDIHRAYKLMCLAKKIRPNGPLICSKTNYYLEELKKCQRNL